MKPSKSFKNDEEYKFAHNIKNDLFVVLGYLQFNEYDKAKTKIKELCKTNIEVKTLYITNNKIIDTFLHMKITQAEQKGIECYTNKLSKNTLPSFIKFYIDMDICQAIGNAFDNAIEYLSKINNDKYKKIDMVFNFADDILCCKISNYVESGFEINNAIIKTSKKNFKMHGFGITNIIEITTRYNGKILFNQENNILETTLSFKIPKLD